LKIPTLRILQIAEEDYQLCSNVMDCYLEPKTLKERLGAQFKGNTNCEISADSKNINE
jgi:hypothetical protein